MNGTKQFFKVYLQTHLSSYCTFFANIYFYSNILSITRTCLFFSYLFFRALVLEQWTSIMHSFSFDARWFKWQWPCQVELVLDTMLGYSIGPHSHRYANKMYCCRLRSYVLDTNNAFVYLLNENLKCHGNSPVQTANGSQNFVNEQDTWSIIIQI